MGKDLIEHAQTVIAGKKHGHKNEVKAQVDKAKKTGVATTHDVVKNVLPPKKLKLKY